MDSIPKDLAIGLQLQRAGAFRKGRHYYLNLLGKRCVRELTSPRPWTATRRKGVPTDDAMKGEP